MAMAEAPVRRAGGSAVLRSTPSSSGLYDVLELILDKGLVIDAYVRVSLVGIELLTVDARVVVASVDTYLRFAEAVNRLDIRAQSNEETTNMEEITSGIGGGMKAMGTKKAAGGVVDKVGEKFKELTGDDDDEEDEDQDQGQKQRAEDGADDDDGARRRPARARKSSGNGDGARSGARRKSSSSSSSSSSGRRRRSSED